MSKKLSRKLIDFLSDDAYDLSPLRFSFFGEDMSLTALRTYCQELKNKGLYLQVSGERLKGKTRPRLACDRGPVILMTNPEEGVGQLLPEKVIDWIEGELPHAGERG